MPDKAAASLYIHIPFCRKKCIYCDFYSRPYREGVAEAYIGALARQVAALEGVFKTIYVGGGTPTVLDKDSLLKLFASLKGRLDTSTEFTVEANPESLSEEKIGLMLDSGVNRLSIGVQSLRDNKLSRLGRAHNSRAARQAVILSSGKGFRNISIDLIYGVWEETGGEWREELDEAARLPVSHVSCYALTYEKGTPLFNALEARWIKPLEDEAVASMYEYTIDRLSALGFKQYEVSNFARKGFECRHNLNYWENGPYIGLGASAVSYIEGTRGSNIHDAAEYVRALEDGSSPLSSSERLPPVKMAKETAAVKIRTKSGIDFGWFRERTGFDFMGLEKRAVKDLIEKGLIKFKKDKSAVTGICLRPKGFLFCDTVSSDLL